MGTHYDSLFTTGVTAISDNRWYFFFTVGSMTLAAIQIHILVCQTSNSLNVVKINVKQITYLVMIDSDLVEGHQNPFKDVWKNGAQPFKKS